LQEVALKLYICTLLSERDKESEYKGTLRGMGYSDSKTENRKKRSEGEKKDQKKL
jgi:hypothetical protein